MEKREKKKTSKLRRVRPRLNLSIDPENHEYLKEIGVNASRLLDKAVNELRKVSHHGLVLISEKKEELWARPDSNRRTPPCQGDVITEPVSGSDPKEGFDDFSKTSREQSISNKGMSISEYVADANVGKRYLEYAERTGVSDEKTRNGYLNGLRSLQPVRTPTDLSEYQEMYGTNITDPQRKGLLKFFRFIKTKELRKEWNGYEIGSYLDNLKIAETGAAKKGSRLKDITDAEIRAARERLAGESTQVYFSLMAYSGARHNHLYQALEKKRPIERVGDNAIRINVKDLSIGKKFEAHFYFPAEMEAALSRYTHQYSVGHLQKLIAASGTAERPVNAATLRKWHYNKMRAGGDPIIDATAADHIQGRVPKSTGDKEYANLDQIAAERYPVIVPKLKKALPLIEKETPAPKKEKPNPAPKRVEKKDEPLPSNGRDMQALYLKHAEEFRDWCKRTNTGVIIRPSGTIYYDHPPKLENLLRACPNIMKPKDVKPVNHKWVVALRKFILYLTKAGGEPTPLGVSRSGWDDHLEGYGTR